MSAAEKPTRLGRGSRIRVVSPSCDGVRRFPKRVQRGVDFLRSTYGFVVSVDPIPAEHDDPPARVALLTEAMTSPDVDAVVWAIGGLTACELLDDLPYAELRHHQRLMFGYSDATVIFWACHANGVGYPIYGPALIPQFGESPKCLPETDQSFQRIALKAWHGEYAELETVVDEYRDWTLTEPNSPRGRKQAAPRRRLLPGVMRGPVLAGCLPSVVQLLGTPYLPDVSGHVLILETSDGSYGAGETRRDLWQLHHAGLLRAAAGLVMGRHRGWSHEDRAMLDQVLVALGERNELPVLVDFEVGHTDPLHSVPLGRLVEVEDTRVRLLEPAVC